MIWSDSSPIRMVLATGLSPKRVSSTVESTVVPLPSRFSSRNRVTAWAVSSPK